MDRENWKRLKGLRRLIHDGVLSITYGSIHAINQAAEMTSGWVVDRLAQAGDGDGREYRGKVGNS
jgi:hypothetical protein